MSPDQPIPPPTDDELRKRRVPLQRKISLKFKEFRGFITEHSANISMGGMFIHTDSPQPPGTIFDFEFTLGDGYTLIHGIGEVVWVREQDEGADRPAGMGVRFLNLDPESRQLVDRIVLERLRKQGTSHLPSSPAPEPWEAPPAGEDEALEQEESEDAADSWNLEEAPTAASAAVFVPPAASEPSAFRLFDEDEPEAELPTELLAVPGADRSASGPPSDPGSEGDGDDAWATVTDDDRNEPGEEPAVTLRDDDGDGDGDDWRLSQPPTSPVGTADEPDLSDLHVAPPAPIPSVSQVPRPGAGERVPLTYSRSRVGSLPPEKGPSRARLVLLAAVALALLAVTLFLTVPSSTRDSLFASFRGLYPDRDFPPAETAPADTPSGADPRETGDAAGPGGPDDSRGATDQVADPEAQAADGGEAAAGVLAVADAEGNVREVVPDEPPPPVRQAPPEEPLADPIPASGPFGRLLGVTWQERGDRTVVILQLDGKIEEWSYSTASLSGPPRVLVRLQGATGPYSGSASVVDDPRVQRVRVGYHPGAEPGPSDDELHVVVDLTAADVRLATTDATGAELRLTFAHGSDDG